MKLYIGLNNGMHDSKLRSLHKEEFININGPVFVQIVLNKLMTLIKLLFFFFQLNASSPFFIIFHHKVSFWCKFSSLLRHKSLKARYGKRIRDFMWTSLWSKTLPHAWCSHTASYTNPPSLKHSSSNNLV